ncbi:hypothetical protein H2198_009371 [Neophaeococcomyces mojaviensis]|uniref:Uncharacterized protein n=1 Tax=Neophaeococcomyces mojaviensis TaxID=3383035 RepID=A0ACC2ZUZ3_9EURO|nr:hypothetical protein H2198_009371 [Knufia sp. JES_112]
MSLNRTIVDASIESLAAALSSGRLTSVDLVAKYLLRISTYDCRDIVLNSIPLINENVFNEAAAADDRRAAGTTCGVLDGIPFTVKDSYKVKGMTVASGSEAFEALVANEDAFTVRALKDAGAVLIGKTNMCPMAYGGMLRGLYGRAESPYNLDYLPAAFGSGSSNGSGVSTTASFAAFGMGEETVSSGRSPASNNGLIAYTPSRGLISIRGNWPLYPTCDVVVPHTRTMDDLFALLDVITTADLETTGDFWRDQPFFQPPHPWLYPLGPFSAIKNVHHLNGKRIAIPQMYIKQRNNGPFVSKAVEHLWAQTQADLEATGAKVEIVTEFPVMQAYQELLTRGDGEGHPSFGLPNDWNATERGRLIAYAWEDFLQQNSDRNFPSLAGIDPKQIFPHLPPDDPQVKFTEPANAVHWSKLAGYVENRPQSTRPGKSCIYDIPHLEAAVKALEDMRKHCFEDWMYEHKFDYVAFPAAGDVARADADTDYPSAEHAWKDGVKYSHGNRALRHMGIPSVTVPMGMLEDSRMPMGLTFLGRAYNDIDVLKAAYAYEQKAQRRTMPPLTPPLASDVIPEHGKLYKARPNLVVTRCSVTSNTDGYALVSIEGIVSMPRSTIESEYTTTPELEIFIDGTKVKEQCVRITSSDTTSSVMQFFCDCLVPRPPAQDPRNRVKGKIARDSTMVMVLARNGEGRPIGYLKLIHLSDQ